MTQPALPLIEEKLPGNIAFDMLLVEGGEYLMGDADEEALDREKPVHRVKLFTFYLGKYPVTQAVWRAVMEASPDPTKAGENPSRFKGENRPVEQVSWNDVQKFLKKLNSLTKQDYRLPTEAEWEFAARGGLHSEEYLYAGSDKLRQVGWYDENRDDETHEVGQKLKNELGLYDMSGNVYEWCYDWYDEKYYEECYKKGVVEDPQGPVQGDYRVVRGGSYFGSALNCRAASRHGHGPANRGSSFGFRLALSLQSVG